MLQELDWMIQDVSGALTLYKCSLDGTVMNMKLKLYIILV
jgi:hypothetical protein